MLLSTDGRTALFGVRIPLDDFPRLVERHLANVPDTRELEAQAEQLIRDRTPL